MKRWLIVGALRLHGYTRQAARDLVKKYGGMLDTAVFEEDALHDVIDAERHNCSDTCPCDLAEIQWFNRMLRAEKKRRVRKP
jgi:hypothetical protein